MISIHAPRVGSDLAALLLGARLFYFNPRSPCGERRCHARKYLRLLEFQSTLPVWGATVYVVWFCKALQFQSTLPVWGATMTLIQYAQNELISIHAPRVGSDQSMVADETEQEHFNPRSPCGERHEEFVLEASLGVFQSTLPVWGATRRYARCRHRKYNFNPRSPCGERRV